MNCIHSAFVIVLLLETGTLCTLLWKIYAQYFFMSHSFGLCKDDFTMIACHVERDPQNLLFEDWTKIRRSSIIGYIKRLACKCAAAARTAGYRGFALYGLAGCYGRTRASLHRVVRKKKNYSLCIGNQIKKNCQLGKHSYCIGRSYAETVYVLNVKGEDGPGEWQKWGTCNKYCGPGIRERKWSCLYSRTPGMGCPEFPTKVQYKSCKLQACPGGMICESTNTIFQTQGNGYLMYVDRHRLKCRSNTAMSMFRLQRRGYTMRFQFSCCRKRANVCNLQRRVTEFSKHGSWKINVLHKHKIDCGSGSFLSQFNMEMNQQQDQFRYVYYCCNPQRQRKRLQRRTTTLKCYDSTTHFSSAGNGRVYHLEQQVVSCRRNYALNSFVQEIHNDQTKIRYRYRCCRFY